MTPPDPAHLPAGQAVGQAAERLRKMLRVEAGRGYDDRAVAGGLAAFVPHWLTQAGPATPGAAEVAQLLRRYSQSPPTERPAIVDRVLGRLTAFDGGAGAPPAPQSRGGMAAGARLDGGGARPADDQRVEEVAADHRGGPRPAPVGVEPGDGPEPKSPRTRTAPPRADRPAPPSDSAGSAEPLPPPPSREGQPPPALGAGGRPSSPPSREEPARPLSPPSREDPGRPPAPPSREEPGGPPSSPRIGGPGGRSHPPAWGGRGGRQPGRGRAREPLTLDSPVTRLAGIKGANGSKLGRLGVFTVRDLLMLFPNRHVDYSDLRPIRELTVGEEATIAATVFSVDLPRLSRAGRTYVRVTLADDTGTALATWFNPHVADGFYTGMRLYVSGRVQLFEGRPAFASPEWEPIDSEAAPAAGGEGPVHTARIVPVYPLTGDLKQRWLRARMAEVVPRWTPELPDYLPEWLRRAEGLLGLGEAVAAMHFPRSQTELAAARARLAFDELFLIQVGVLQRRLEQRRARGLAIAAPPGLVEAFEASLPFRFTGAQRRALAEILADMAGGPPMTRLLQGDVGSGKTVVAAAAAVVARHAGYQSALMVPTEILAEQHHRSIARLVGEEPVAEAPLLALGAPPAGGEGFVTRLRLGLVTGSTPRAARQRTIEATAAGEIDLLIGTHALIQESVEFANLGLAIVDEQHRFGVEQRAMIRAKGQQPHLLVMTATPIPRTLALTLYGDLDVSVIDELPPGRQPVRTRAVGPDKRHLAYEFVRKRIAAGEQVFIICPLVEESEKIEAKAATAEFERLRNEVFPELAERMGLLHGRMPAREKDAVMARFRAHVLDILVSTAVVEVGVDVPNATVMLIEGADRFGLAQLHQFRGRVGRGDKPAYCVLISESSSPEAAARLAAMERTANGFELAEEDLRLRGPGEFFGTRQSGLPDLRVASLGDTVLLTRARAAAERLLARDPWLRRPEHGALAERVASFWRGAAAAG